MAGRAPRPQQAPVALAPVPRVSGPTRPGQEAADQALAQLAFAEGPQVGILGDNGTGKTTASRYLIAEYLRRSPGSVLIVDDKEVRSKFERQYRRDRNDLADHPIEYEKGRVIVFRGDPARGERVNLEEIAELAWSRAQRGRKTLCVWDELIAGREELAKNMQWRKGVTWVPRNFTMGRSPGVGDLWGAQSPQSVPVEVFEQTHAILCFRLAGLGLRRLKERDYLDGGAEEAIPRLSGPPMPPAERGEFVLLVRGRPWDGVVYKFAA